MKILEIIGNIASRERVIVFQFNQYFSKSWANQLKETDIIIGMILYIFFCLFIIK